VIIGTKDPDFPDPVAEGKIVAEQTGGTLALVEGAGHYPQTEMPEKTTPIVVDFLKRPFPFPHEPQSAPKRPSRRDRVAAAAGVKPKGAGIRRLTDRLILEEVDQTARPEEFLHLFNTNPDFIEASVSFRGQRAYDLADVGKYLQAETSRPNSHCLALRLRATEELVGTAAIVAPHPDEPFPWIGLLLIDGTWQGQGLGGEAASAIERQLAAEGWTEVRLGVMLANPRARRFWERQGYVVYGEKLDQDKRPVWLMRKALDRGPSARMPEAESA
jgi:RimJ/RimL family protein N-acetyltransferase